MNERMKKKKQQSRQLRMNRGNVFEFGLKRVNWEYYTISIDKGKWFFVGQPNRIKWSEMKIVLKPVVIDTWKMAFIFRGITYKWATIGGLFCFTCRDGRNLRWRIKHAHANNELIMIVKATIVYFDIFNWEVFVMQFVIYAFIIMLYTIDHSFSLSISLLLPFICICLYKYIWFSMAFKRNIPTSSYSCCVFVRRNNNNYS